jgi:hypothetical protein
MKKPRKKRPPKKNTITVSAGLILSGKIGAPRELRSIIAMVHL